MRNTVENWKKRAMDQKGMILELGTVNAIVMIGLYAYLAFPNLMDVFWGISFSFSIVLLIHTIVRELSRKYLIGGTSSVTFLIWIFTAGMNNFWIQSLGMNYHGLVGRLTLIALFINLLLFMKSEHNDLKIISGVAFLSLASGALVGLRLGSNLVG